MSLIRAFTQNTMPKEIEDIIENYYNHMFNVEKKEIMHRELLLKRRMLFHNDGYAIYRNDEIEYLYYFAYDKLCCYRGIVGVNKYFKQKLSYFL